MMLIITAQELAEHDVLHTDACKGKTSISCYPQGRSRKTGRRPASFWTQSYLIQCSHQDFETKVTARFAT